MTRIRSAFRPSGWSHQRTISQLMIAMPISETVYTFSFTTLWFQTVNAVAPMRAARVPPMMRCHRCANQPTSTRSVMRNHMPAETALHTAARTLIRTAMDDEIGRMANTRPISTKRGLPGGWGIPNTWAAVMYSLVSHIAVEGDRVTR